MYRRPKITFTDTMQTKKKIRKLLENYHKISNNDIDNLQLNSHIRYITKIDRKNKIRLGGYLKHIDSKYVVLTNEINNQGISWSVQRTKDNVFFKLIDFRDQAEMVILEQEKKINRQKKKIQQLGEIIKQYKKQIKFLKKS